MNGPLVTQLIRTEPSGEITYFEVLDYQDGSQRSAYRLSLMLKASINIVAIQIRPISEQSKVLTRNRPYYGFGFVELKADIS